MNINKMALDLREASFSIDSIEREETRFAESVKARSYAIHDEVKGGVLYRPGRDRELPMLAACDAGEKRVEVKLSRAMFNRRALQVQTTSEQLAMVAYEAPLARVALKEHGYSHAVGCDLVAVTRPRWRMVAIEVKARKSPDTNLDYGVVESWCYGRILTHLAFDKARHALLMKQAKKCLSRFHNTSLLPKFRHDLPGKHGWQALFAVAAPAGYYREQLKDAEVWSNVRAFVDGRKGFYGFIVLGGDTATDLLGNGWRVPAGIYDEKELLIPILAPDVSITLCRTVDELQERFGG